MAISPPSDLVLDVVRAADPAEVQQAQAKLKANRAAFQATSLAENGGGFDAAVNVLNRTAMPGDVNAPSGLGDIGNRAQVKEIPETYRKFEAMVLQNFVKSMLPSDSEEVYGKGTAGDIWKSMMAEQIGNVIAAGDGIGIAERLLKEGEPVPEDAAARIRASMESPDGNVATGMVQEFQRTVFEKLMSEDTGKERT